MISGFIEWLNSANTLQLLMSNRFFLILSVIVLSSLRHAAYSSMLAAALVNLPGTILHELAHFIVGLLMNAQPVRFSIFPKKVGTYYVTGNVDFRNMKFYNAFPVSMAPLLMLPFGYYCNCYFFDWFSLSLGNYLLYIFLMSVIIENSVPSPQDFRQGFRYISGVAVYITIIVLVLFFYFS